MIPAGTYKVLSDQLLLIWAPEWAAEFAQNYELARNGGKGKYPERLPVGYRVKEGQEIVLTFGDRKVLVRGVGDQAYDITSLEVTVKVGSKTYSGITLAYNENIPSIVVDHNALRPVKKRAK